MFAQLSWMKESTDLSDLVIPGLRLSPVQSSQSPFQRPRQFPAHHPSSPAKEGMLLVALRDVSTLLHRSSSFQVIFKEVGIFGRQHIRIRFNTK